MKKLFLILSIFILFVGCNNSSADKKKETKNYFCIQRKDLMKILISSPTDSRVVINNKYLFFDSLNDLKYTSFDENFYIPMDNFNNLDHVTIKKSRYMNHSFNYSVGLTNSGSDLLIPFVALKEFKIVEK